MRERGWCRMESGLKTETLRVGGMTCVNCQNKLETKLRDTAGIRNAKVSYGAGTAEVTYDAGLITPDGISAVIRRLGYQVLTGAWKPAQGAKRAAGLLIIIASLYLLLRQSGVLNLFVPGRLASAGMSYGMLFVVGLVTSVHCVAMCGGINLSQCIPHSAEIAGKPGRFSTLRPTLLYNLGRVVSYTAVGFLVGGLGSAVAFSNTLQGVLKLAAGVFMVIMGINMLGIFPWLRRLSPRMPKLFAGKIAGRKSGGGPLAVGLLNGLMPCGPLQAMQIYALSTGSPFSGAFSMFLFSLGTVPLMLGLGALSSALGKKFTRKAMTAGAVLVVALGLSMLSQGLGLSGFSLPQLVPYGSGAQAGGSGARTEHGVQVVESSLSPGGYPSITVQAGMPVKWIIDAPQGSVNGCNYKILIPEYKIERELKTGKNVIEFTPARAGNFPYSCWMGMIRSSISVVEAPAASG